MPSAGDTILAGLFEGVDVEKLMVDVGALSRTDAVALVEGQVAVAFEHWPEQAGARTPTANYRVLAAVYTGLVGVAMNHRRCRSSLDAFAQVVACVLRQRVSGDSPYHDLWTVLHLTRALMSDACLAAHFTSSRARPHVSGVLQAAIAACGTSADAQAGALLPGYETVAKAFAELCAIESGHAVGEYWAPLDSSLVRSLQNSDHRKAAKALGQHLYDLTMGREHMYVPPIPPGDPTTGSEGQARQHKRQRTE